MHAEGWTPERQGRAVDLWKEGKTGSEIARELGGGLTRVAVVAKINRLGLTRASCGLPPRWKTDPSAAQKAAKPRPVVHPRPAPVASKPARKRGKTRVYVRPDLTPERVAEIEAAGLHAMAAFNLRDDAVPLILRPFGSQACAWPLGEPERPADQMCCGQPVQPERPYCPEHSAIAFTPMTPRQRENLSKIGGLR